MAQTIVDFDKKESMKKLLLPIWHEIKSAEPKPKKGFNLCKALGILLLGLYIGSTLTYVFLTTTNYLNKELLIKLDEAETKMEQLKEESERLRLANSGNEMTHQQILMGVMEAQKQHIAQINALTHELELTTQYYNGEVAMAYMACAQNQEELQKNLDASVDSDLAIHEAHNSFTEEMQILEAIGAL
uniref:Uncharacterized protein n=1 Tax=Acrobeloides nanus TaxID=290746 RepID=A0A914DJH7_9BILA